MNLVNTIGGGLGVNDWNEGDEPMLTNSVFFFGPFGGHRRQVQNLSRQMIVTQIQQRKVANVHRDFLAYTAMVKMLKPMAL